MLCNDAAFEYYMAGRDTVELGRPISSRIGWKYFQHGIGIELLPKFVLFSKVFRVEVILNLRVFTLF